jgi:hypothetical protein
MLSTREIPYVGRTLIRRVFFPLEQLIDLWQDRSTAQYVESICIKTFGGRTYAENR